MDGFASYNNREVTRYFTYGFQIEAEGTDFFTQKLCSSDVILIHCHSLMLYDVLTPASNFKCKVVVVLHLWQGYPPYRNFLRGGHLPYFCENIKLTRINFKAGSLAPAFTGLRNFSSCIFNIRFTGEVLFPIWLQTEGSQQEGCLLGSCFVCDSSL